MLVHEVVAVAVAVVVLGVGSKGCCVSLRNNEFRRADDCSTNHTHSQTKIIKNIDQ
jgi:hypothetical protein